MIRTKKPTESIKEIEFIEDIPKLITAPFGGHLPYPPDNCEKRKLTFINNGITWLDLSICHSCKIIKKCKDRKIFLIKLNGGKRNGIIKN